MPRYFLELAYKGTLYSGFQVQQNAPTIQTEVERALKIIYRQDFELTGSSRTDAGVHALQNYFHFDTDLLIETRHIYNLNAILPQDITVKGIYQVSDTAHCRFDAISRAYRYFLYNRKDPFQADRGWLYPYPLDISLLQQAASLLMQYEDFTSFSKRNTQVKTFRCRIGRSEWGTTANGLIYNVESNRFLRGMVRGLVGTMLKVGRGQIDMAGFRAIIEAKDCSQADFTTPPQGLFLVSVVYPEGLVPGN
jgi:tRNA pseudouridine38-40 synthase